MSTPGHDPDLDQLRALADEPIEQNTAVQLALDFLLFLVLFVTPWLISIELKEVFNTTKNCFLGLVSIGIVALFIIDTVGRGEIQLPRTGAWGVLGLFAIWITLSLGWGGSFTVASRDWAYHMALFSLFFVTSVMVTSRDRMENLLHFAIAAGVVVAGFATLQYYGLDDPILRGLSDLLYREDPSRIDPATNTPKHSGLLAILFDWETARSLHAKWDPRLFILPSKPEEPSKNYSFMGHRNYLAGYVIAVIPLVMSRLMAHVDVLLKESRETELYTPAMRDAMRILSMILAPVALLAFKWPLFRWLALFLGAALVICFITHLLARSVFIYLASLVLMFVTVVQTHTRGAWIGLMVGIPFLLVMVFAKEHQAARREDEARAGGEGPGDPAASDAPQKDEGAPTKTELAAAIAAVSEATGPQGASGAAAAVPAGSAPVSPAGTAQPSSTSPSGTAQPSSTAPATEPATSPTAPPAASPAAPPATSPTAPPAASPAPPDTSPTPPALAYPPRASADAGFDRVYLTFGVLMLTLGVRFMFGRTTGTGLLGKLSSWVLVGTFLFSLILGTRMPSARLAPGLAWRFGLFCVAFLIKVYWVGQTWSWIPVLCVGAELVLYYAWVAFRPRFLHRASVALTILPLVLITSAFIWKDVDLPFLKVKNPLNKEWVSALDRFDDTFKFGTSTSTHQRWLIYMTTLRIILDSPQNFLFGTGIGTFGLHYMPYQAKVLSVPENESLIPESNKSIYAHNEYLHYWSELGLVGLLLFIATGLLFFWRVWQDLRACTLDYDTLLYLGIVSSLMAVMGHIFFSFCLHLAYTGSLFYVMAAFALRFFPGPVIRLNWKPRATRTAEAAGIPFHSGLAVDQWGHVRGWVRFLMPAVRRLTDAGKDARPDLPGIQLTVTDPSGRVAEQKFTALRSGHAIASGDEFRPVGEVSLQRPAESGLWSYRATCGDEVIGQGEIEVGATGLLPQAVAAGVLIVAGTYVAQQIVDVAMAERHWRDAFMKFRMQKFEESFLDYTKAIERDGSKGEILFDFGRALMDSQRNEAAMKVFLKATENFVDPANYHNIALCYFKEAGKARDRGDKKGYEHFLERTEWAYRKALELNVVYEQALSNLIFMLTDKALDDPAKAKEHLAEAERMGVLGVKNYRHNAQFWTAYGVVLARSEKFDESVPPLLRALWLMLQERARRRASELKAELETQRTTFNQAAAQPSTDPSRMRELTDKMADLETQQKLLQQALERTNKRFHEIIPFHNNFQFFHAKFSPAERKKHFEETLKGYLEIVHELDAFPGMTLDVNADRIRINLAGIFQNKGNPTESMRLLENVTDKSDPVGRGRYFALVVEHYRKRMTDNPGDLNQLTEYARRLVSWGFDSEATRALYGLLEKNPMNREALLMLAESLYRQKYYEDSIKEYQKVLASLSAADPMVPRIKARIEQVELDRMREKDKPKPSPSAGAPAPGAAPGAGVAPVPVVPVPSAAPGAVPLPMPSAGPGAVAPMPPAVPPPVPGASPAASAVPVPPAPSVVPPPAPSAVASPAPPAPSAAASPVPPAPPSPAPSPVSVHSPPPGAQPSPASPSPGR